MRYFRIWNNPLADSYIWKSMGFVHKWKLVFTIYDLAVLASVRVVIGMVWFDEELWMVGWVNAAPSICMTQSGHPSADCTTVECLRCWRLGSDGWSKNTRNYQLMHRPLHYWYGVHGLILVTDMELHSTLSSDMKFIIHARLLTHWIRDKMEAIPQTTFSNALPQTNMQ